MSEFTKYELQSLLWAIGFIRARTNNCGDVMRSLRTKIEKMIEDHKEEIHYKCKWCAGEGQLTTQECPECNGKGFYTVE